jgi:serine/threonine protein kinase
MIGTTISHYRIISHLGAGGMGTVYLAEAISLQRRVALKFLSPDTAGHPEAAARLRREARAASALDHPHIATVYEIGDLVAEDGGAMTILSMRFDFGRRVGHSARSRQGRSSEKCNFPRLSMAQNVPFGVQPN